MFDRGPTYHRRGAVVAQDRGEGYALAYIFQIFSRKDTGFK